MLRLRPHCVGVTLECNFLHASNMLFLPALVAKSSASAHELRQQRAQSPIEDQVRRNGQGQGRMPQVWMCVLEKIFHFL